MSGVLLDTCAIIWFATGQLSPEAQAVIDDHAGKGEAFYSAISAWEVGLLGRPRREGPRLRFEPDPITWFDRFRAAPGLRELRLSADIAIAAAFLPSEVHADPADRFLIATARHRGIPLMTSDRRILDCAQQGILEVIACRPLSEPMP